MVVLMNGEQTHLNRLFISGVLFIFFASVYSALYVIISKRRNPYLQILVGSAFLTAILFALDYLILDNDPPNPPLRRIIFECTVYGTGYTVIFFALFGGLYFLGNKAAELFARQR